MTPPGAPLTAQRCHLGGFGVHLGVILGTCLGQFRLKSVTRNRLKKQHVVLRRNLGHVGRFGVRFWQLFANIWCREAIVNEKGEPVFLSIVVWFLMILRVHWGLKIINVIKI